MATKKKEDSLTIEDKLKTALVPEDEQPYRIPGDWVWTRLGEISLDPQYGWTTSATSEGEVRLLRTTDITAGQIDWSSVPYCKETPADLEKYLIRDGDIVISRAGSVGFSHLIKNPEKAVFASYLIRFKPLIVHEYLAHFLKSQIYWDAISESSSGIAIPNVNASKLKQISIPVAPLPEQQRIAEKLESLLGKIKEAKALLDEVPQILQNFRQSVLAAACSGRLTENWRREHPDEKSSFITQRQGQGHQIFEIPETWAVITVKDVSTKIEYGYTASSNKSPVGPKLLRITDIQDGKVNWEDVPYCEIEERKKVRFLLAPGDIVFARTGATTGKSFIIEECPDAVFASYLIRIKPGSQIIPKYMYFFFQSEFYWKQIYENLSGIAQPNCNATKLSLVNLPHPSLSEQEEIVRFIESLFDKADDLEAQYKTAMELIESLPEVILSKAFRGELVPQNPSDEPASAILDRIIGEEKVSRDKSPKRFGN